MSKNENNSAEVVVDVSKITMAELIREKTAEGKLTRQNDFTKEPLSLSKEDADSKLAELFTDPEYVDLAQIKGAKNMYYYSKDQMADNYAAILARIEDKDLLFTVAETVREESRIYPRPADIRTFSRPPFNIPANILAEVMANLAKEPKYADIQQTAASNGAVFLFSDKYLHPKLAAATAEWIEVEEPKNP